MNYLAPQFRLVVTSVVLALFAGCAPSMNVYATFKLPVGEISPYIIDAVGVEQTLKITAKSPGVPISVYVYLQENEPEAERMITLDKPSDLIIASTKKAEDISLEAEIPANKEAVVYVASSSRETADVQLSITN